MTKREREVTDLKEILGFMDRGKVIHLGLCDGDQPYVVPMNYGYTYENEQMTIYLHGATQGYKYEVLEKNAKVSFSIECDLMPFEGDLACQYGIAYSSVFGKGVAVMVDDIQEKMNALSILMRTQTGKDFEFNEKLVSIVNIIRIDVRKFTAKKRPLPETHVLK